MRQQRWMDLVLVLVIVAVVAHLTRSPAQDTPKASPSQVSAAMGKAIPFELESVDGRRLRYDAQSPAILVLTAIGCGGCIARVHQQDAELTKWATAHQLPVYNLLVYADRASGAAFVAEHQPTAPTILVDPGGQVSVTQYQGSDDNCWMVVGPDGSFLYRGGTDLPRLIEACKGLCP
jgi:hypothetical protein